MKRLTKDFFFNINFVCVLSLIILYVVLRIFVPSPTYLMAGDEARYLALAQTFPTHTMYQTIFLQHMPAYPYLIAIVDFVVNNDFASGILVSFGMELFFALVLLAWFKLLNKPTNWVFLFFLFFSLNWIFIEFSRIVFKESTYVAFFWAAVVFYWYGLLKSEKWFWLSGLMAIFTAFSSDQVVFLFPVLIITGFLMKGDDKYDWKSIKKNFRKYLYKFLPIILGALAYAFWLGIRLNFYFTHTAAPIGVDGVIEDVTQFNIMQVFSPFSLPESQPLTDAKFVFDPLRISSTIGYLFDMHPFVIPGNLNRSTIGSILHPAPILFILLFYLPLILFVTYWALKKYVSVFRKKEFFNNIYFVLLLCFIVLIAPISTGVGVWRHVILAMVPLFFITVDALYSKVEKYLNFNYVKYLFVLFVIIFSTFWIVQNPNLSFASKPVVQGYALADEIKTLPGDGIFVQSGYSMEQPYLLPDKRIYGIPRTTEKFLKYIPEFNITYIALGNKTWSLGTEPSLDYIREHPELFIPIRTVYETYPENIYPLSEKTFETDTFVIYEVNKTKFDMN